MPISMQSIAWMFVVCMWLWRVASWGNAFTFTFYSWDPFYLLAGAIHCSRPENSSLLSARLSASPVITSLSLIPSLK